MGRSLSSKYPSWLPTISTCHSSLSRHDFLEILFADKVARRDREATQLRASAAHLDPTMHLEAWDDTTPVSFDRTL